MEGASGSISSIPLSEIRRVGFTSERVARRRLRTAFESAPADSESFPQSAAEAISEQIRRDSVQQGPSQAGKVGDTGGGAGTGEGRDAPQPRSRARSDSTSGIGSSLRSAGANTALAKHALARR